MFQHLTIGNQSPKVVNVIVEIPKDTHNKYEYDEHLGLIRLDRTIFSPFYYPVDYGFVPGTRSQDGDHLDIMIITNSPTFPGCLLEARPIGVLVMEDDKGVDEKILAVPIKNPEYETYFQLSHVSPHFLREVEHFFAEYKKLEYKKVEVRGWEDRVVAEKIICDSANRFLLESPNTNPQLPLD